MKNRFIDAVLLLALVQNTKDQKALTSHTLYKNG